MGLSIEDLYGVRGTILLTGETGCGKSFLAAQIHERSPLKQFSFLTLNMATMVEELLESELFGHLKGSFTGAYQDKKGLAERVGQGTLFLDEIGELGPRGQKKLLYLLEEKKFLPVGGHQEKEFRGRIIAATNKNLPEMVKRGEFRQDLYFRLRVFYYPLKPVREGPEKVSSLLNHFLEIYKKNLGKRELEISPPCRELLLNYPWYGNIREIKNTVEYMVTVAKGSFIVAQDLPEWILSFGQQGPGSAVTLIPEHFPLEYQRALETFEGLYFSYVLKKFQGRVNITAKTLKISKATLISKAKKYGINTSLLRAQKTPSPGFSFPLIDLGP